MKKFVSKVGIFLLCASLLIVFYLLYEQLAHLIQYKQTVLGIASNYLTLQKQYEDYYEQTKNLKQVIILAKNKESNINRIEDAVNNYTKNIEGDISIYYKNLTTNESLVLNPDQKYYMASLYKVILTAFILHEVENGKTTLSAKIGTSSATLKDGLAQIITESNNEYAQAIANEYGWRKIEKQMKDKFGIEFSFTEKLEISIRNVGILFEDIALALNLPQSESNHLLTLLENQKRRSKLPKYLPANIYSHNKTGEFGDYSHDAGIFYTPKANYILVFMSKAQNPSATNEQMALMSKEIYELLNKL